MIHSYPWYIADWRGSEAVLSMTLAERGLYRELLDHCWESGNLPNSEVVLIKISRCSEKEFRKAWPIVKLQFYESEGRLWHVKVDEKRRAIEEWHDSRREAGRKGGLAKAASKRSSSASSSANGASKAGLYPSTSPQEEPIGQSSSGFKKKKPDLNSEKLTTTDEKPKPVYATPKDELKALMLECMGHRPENGFFVQLCEIIELRGGTVPEYVSDMRERIKRLNGPPGEGFFRSEAKKIGGPDVAPMPEPKVEQPKNGHGRCLLCSGVGHTDKGFCSCAMGVDLAVIAARPQKEAS